MEFDEDMAKFFKLEGQVWDIKRRATPTPKIKLTLNEEVEEDEFFFTSTHIYVCYICFDPNTLFFLLNNEVISIDNHDYVWLCEAHKHQITS